jgi:hypothetical protein
MSIPGLGPKTLALLHKKIGVTSNKRKDPLPHILIGSEVDILGDGKLDYPDDILAKLDRRKTKLPDACSTRYRSASGAFRTNP